MTEQVYGGCIFRTRSFTGRNTWTLRPWSILASPRGRGEGPTHGQRCGGGHPCIPSRGRGKGPTHGRGWLRGLTGTWMTPTAVKRAEMRAQTDACHHLRSMMCTSMATQQSDTRMAPRLRPRIPLCRAEGACCWSETSVPRPSRAETLRAGISVRTLIHGQIDTRLFRVGLRTRTHHQPSVRSGRLVL